MNDHPVRVEEALKACPFCGGDKISHVPGCNIACMNINCGGQVDMGSPWGGPEEDGIAFLIAAWNTRAPHPIEAQGGEGGDRGAIAREAEQIILRRLFNQTIDGYTLDMSLEIADAILATSPAGAAK